MDDRSLPVETALPLIHDKLICMTGLPASGKSSVTAALGHLINSPAFCEPEESAWPDCVTQRNLSGAFGAHMWFRSLRTCQLYQAAALAKAGRTVLVDSYFDKLLYFCLGKPGMEWLIPTTDTYFEIAREMAKLDLEALPLPDCLIVFLLDYETWCQLLQTRRRRTEKGLFSRDVFRMQDYICAGVDFLRTNFGITTITIQTEFSSPLEMAKKVWTELYNNNKGR